MITQTRISRSTLFMLIMLLAGCASSLRPDGIHHPGQLFSIVAPDARTVSVAGSFNRWDPLRHPLSGPDRSGRRTISFDLPPGRYEYLFVVNGDTWVLDPAAPSVENGLGERNSIISVPDDSEGAE